MINNQFDFLIEELSKEFKKQVEKVKLSNHIDMDTFKVNCEKAESVALEFINGRYFSAEGKRTNSSGQYINDQHELVDNEGRRVNDDGFLINDNEEVIGKKQGGLTLHYYRKEKIEDYIKNLLLNFEVIDLLKKNNDLNKINLNVYLFLAFLSYKWGMHKSNQAEEGECSEGLKYLFSALEFINRWAGGNTVLNINREYDRRKRALSNSAKLGGEKRAENYRHLKEKVVELLLEHMPTEGWKSKRSAIDTIIWFMNNDKKEVPTKAWDTLPRTISDWSRNDPKIKKTFAQVVKKRS